MMEGIKQYTRSYPVQSLVCLFLSLSLLTIPISSTLKSICLVFAVGFIIISPTYHADLRAVLSRFWCQATLALFFLIVIGCFYGPATLHEKMMVIDKYTKLLYLPILVVGFRDKRARDSALHAFLLAMCITCVLSFMKSIGLVYFNGEDPGQVFRNHIMTGYMTAFGAYISALLFTRQRGSVRVVYALLFLLFSYQLFFINTGRTGYVIYSLLAGLFTIQLFSWRQAIIAMVIGSALIIGIYNVNPQMHQSVQEAVNGWKSYKQHENGNTTVGFRMQFHNYAKGLFLNHPWFGNGTGSFVHLYNTGKTQKEKPVPGWNGGILLEPHSEYWLIASELGLAGLIALAVFFGSLLQAILRLPTLRPFAIAVLLAFLVGNISESLLFYSGTGFFFIVLMALCLGEQIKLSAITK